MSAILLAPLFTIHMPLYLFLICSFQTSRRSPRLWSLLEIHLRALRCDLEKTHDIFCGVCVFARVCVCVCVCVCVRLCPYCSRVLHELLSVPPWIHTGGVHCRHGCQERRVAQTDGSQSARPRLDHGCWRWCLSDLQVRARSDRGIAGPPFFRGAWPHMCTMTGVCNSWSLCACRTFFNCVGGGGGEGGARAPPPPPPPYVPHAGYPPEDGVLFSLPDFCDVSLHCIPLIPQFSVRRRPGITVSRNRLSTVVAFLIFPLGFVVFSLPFSDTICDLGFCDQLANYGEYSGAPSESQTFEYAKTILSLMTKEKDDRGK